jgi:hypothetical protein
MSRQYRNNHFLKLGRSEVRDETNITETNKREKVADDNDFRNDDTSCDMECNDV